MKIVKSIQTLNFRMKLRKSLLTQPIDLVIITKEEAIREINRRNKRK